ncbi:MAG: hypothetical protein ABFS86_03520 [Planctomycetota bacterium]
MRKTTILTIALLVALPAAMVMAGPVMKAYLCRTDAGGDTMRGKVKIKANRDGDLHLFSVQIKNADAGDYDVYLVDSEDVETDIGDISVADGEDSGKLKFNMKRGDVLDVDPVGQTVEIRSGEDTLLTAKVPDPTAPKVKGNAKSKLAPPEIDPLDEKAKGFVQLKAGNGAHFLKVVVQKAGSGTWAVMVDSEKVGEIVIADGDNSGSWMANDKKGDPIPTGADCFEDLIGLDIEIVDGEGAVLLEGTIPSFEKKGGPKK